VPAPNLIDKIDVSNRTIYPMTSRRAHPLTNPRTPSPEPLFPPSQSHPITSLGVHPSKRHRIPPSGLSELLMFDILLASGGVPNPDTIYLPTGPAALQRILYDIVSLTYDT
jgi:hypothetical protein